MSVNFNCDCCGKTIKTVSRKGVKDYIKSTEGDFCDSCKSRLSELENRIKNFKARLDSKFIEFTRNAESDYIKMVKELAGV
jgi:hypothetical protein